LGINLTTDVFRNFASFQVRYTSAPTGRLTTNTTSTYLQKE